MLAKIYVDGFKIDEVQASDGDDDLREIAMTPKVMELIHEEKRNITGIISVPILYPKYIYITTEI